ncbi:MAG: nucleotidyltransferase family protein [Rhodobiaceae bacterium]|nr:nucleotidyltransferase family protein [Rhodobiaceae bacterium]MCC0054206.1 nucleotidyltransferase family protein [Rhodobiaceae bacterium]
MSETNGIDRAMVLAAGLGKRMRPLTDTLPKPLVEVDGRALIDHVLDKAAQAGVMQAVVNVHHLADKLEAHLAARREPEIRISDERGLLLETGGGVRRALPLLGDGPFFVLNSDSFWIDGARPMLSRMAEAWDGKKMDVLLALASTATATGYDGRGDFLMDAEGHLSRRPAGEVAAFAYMGVAIMTPALFAGTPEGTFSLNVLFDAAIERERLFGLRLDGRWMHVGTPQAIGEAETAIADSTA